MRIRIEFEGRRAVAVVWRRGKGRYRVRARREIVLGAGAFNSPKLLMLSGIGDGDALKEHGIPVVQEVAGGRGKPDGSPAHRHPGGMPAAGLAGREAGRRREGAGGVALARAQGRAARRQPLRVRRVHSQRGRGRVSRRPALPVPHRGSRKAATTSCASTGSRCRSARNAASAAAGSGWPRPIRTRRRSCASTIWRRNGTSSSSGPASATPGRSSRSRPCGICTAGRSRRDRR